MQATSDLNNKPNQNPQTHKPNKEKIERKKKNCERKWQHGGATINC